MLPSPLVLLRFPAEAEEQWTRGVLRCNHLNVACLVKINCMFTYLTKLSKGLKDHFHNAGIADAAYAVCTCSSSSFGEPAVPKPPATSAVSSGHRALLSSMPRPGRGSPYQWRPALGRLVTPHASSENQGISQAASVGPSPHSLTVSHLHPFPLTSPLSCGLMGFSP